jgi:cell division protein FtsW (lipid II flippase)
LKRPDFFVTELDTKDEVIIRKASYIPSVFNIIEGGRTVGTITMLSILRNKYSISIDDVTWTFHMPLFTIFFFGKSKKGAEIWVRIGPSERQWNILIKPGVVQRPLVAALALIHNERYFRG